MSAPTVSGLLNIAQLGRLWATTGNLTSGDNFIQKKVVEKRRIRFQPAVRVVLIPSRTEYTEADLNVELWWDDSDYTAFKTSAVSELKSLMRLRNLTNSKDAIRILYQPPSNGETDPYDEVFPEQHPPHLRCVTPSSSPAPTNEEAVDSCGDVCDDSELEIKIVLLAARTDLDLTNPVNFDKIHTGRTDGNSTSVDNIKVHPLAYMCA